MRLAWRARRRTAIRGRTSSARADHSSDTWTSERLRCVLACRAAVFAPSDYHFELPPELIAQEPAGERDASRLLHLHGDGAVSDHRFPDVVELLPADAVLVVNDTRVIPARVLGHKE